MEVTFHQPWSADELRAAIVAADGLLLPYRWGTHSGMVELAADLGVPVLASDVGYLSQQVPLDTFAVRDGTVDAGSLAATLRDVAAGGPHPPVPWVARERAMRSFLGGHRRLYGEVAAAADADDGQPSTRSRAAAATSSPVGSRSTSRRPTLGSHRTRPMAANAVNQPSIGHSPHFSRNRRALATMDRR